MKYLFVAKKFVSIKRGAWTASEDLANEFPQYITLKRDNEIKNIEDVVDGYNKIILVTQVPHLYSFPVHFLSLYKTNHLIFIRSEHNQSSYNSCTNGFYYYKRNYDIKNYVPFIPNVKSIEPTEERYGFYYRPYLNTDACMWFLDRFGDTDEPLITMGEIPIPFMKRNNWEHTRSREEFWSKVTTYIYPMSTKYIDPFPTSVSEAIQTGKEVLFPKLGNRNFMDGIDDCIEVYNYDRSLFDFSNYLPFYTKMLHTGMNNYVNRNEYNNIIDYILSII